MESLSRCMDTEKVSIASCGSRMDVKEIRHEDKENKEILEFKHFVEFFSFNKIGENHREKELVRKVIVVVALDLGCGNTMNSEYESK